MVRVNAERVRISSPRAVTHESFREQISKSNNARTLTYVCNAGTLCPDAMLECPAIRGTEYVVHALRSEPSFITPVPLMARGCLRPDSTIRRRLESGHCGVIRDPPIQPKLAKRTQLK